MFMLSNARRFSLASSILAAAWLAGPSPARAGPWYSIRDVGAGATDLHLNQAGQVAGLIAVGTAPPTPFLDTNGRVQRLDPAIGTPLAVAADGRVVGGAGAGDFQTTTIGTAYPTAVLGGNANGQIVGTAANLGGSAPPGSLKTGFLGTATAPTPSNPHPGPGPTGEVKFPGAVETYPNAINAAGTVAGGVLKQATTAPGTDASTATTAGTTGNSSGGPSPTTTAAGNGQPPTPSGGAGGSSPGTTTAANGPPQATTGNAGNGAGAASTTTNAANAQAQTTPAANGPTQGTSGPGGSSPTTAPGSSQAGAGTGGNGSLATTIVPVPVPQPATAAPTVPSFATATTANATPATAMTPNGQSLTTAPNAQTLTSAANAPATATPANAPAPTTPGADGSSQVAANGNAQAQTASAATGNPPQPSWTTQAFRGNQDLGNLGKDTWTVATAINANGDVTGISGFGPGGLHHAFLAGADGQLVDLGTLPGQLATASLNARAINALDQVVGQASGVDGRGNAVNRAFLYDPTSKSLQDLNALLPAGSGWVLTDATDINNTGQIAGLGLYNGVPSGFVLTPGPGDPVPTPEPSTIVAFGLLALGVGARRRTPRMVD